MSGEDPNLQGLTFIVLWPKAATSSPKLNAFKVPLAIRAWCRK